MCRQASITGELLGRDGDEYQPGFYGRERVSPPTRVFEVAGAGTCLLCDDWPGIDDCFEPGSEILVVKTAQDVVTALRAYDDAGRRSIGKAFRARALRDHTYAQRALQAEAAFQHCLQARAKAERKARGGCAEDAEEGVLAR